MGDQVRDAARSTTLRDVLAPLAVVLLLFAGFFKPLPTVAQLPVDLTMLAAAGVFLAVATQALARVDNALPTGVVGAAIALAIVIGFGLTWPPSSDYASTKRLGLGLVILGALGAVMLVRTAERQRVWVWLHVLVGVILAATATVDTTTGRLGTDTITAGRASGVAIVVLLTLILTGGVKGLARKVAAVAVIVWLGNTLIETGSRGPVLAAVSTVLLVAALSPGGRGRGRRIALAAAAVWTGYQLLTASATVGAARLQAYLSGDAATDQSRPLLWNAAVDSLPETALAGVGWGNFWQVLDANEMLDSGYRQYPHNVILEVAVESGWLPALLVVGFLVAGLRRLHRAAVTPTAAALFAIAVFFLINAMVSGDVLDNRMMWAAVAMGWAVGSGSRLGDSDPERSPRVVERTT